MHNGCRLGRGRNGNERATGVRRPMDVRDKLDKRRHDQETIRSMEMRFNVGSYCDTRAADLGEVAAK
jgi:hypothetical protein